MRTVLYNFLTIFLKINVYTDYVNYVVRQIIVYVKTSFQIVAEDLCSFA